MDCNDVRDDQLDVLYGEADAAATRRVAAHNAGCPICREEFASLRAVRGALASWRLPERSRERRVPSPRSYAGLAIAAGLILAVAGAFRLAGASLEVAAGPVRFSLGAADVRQEMREKDARHEEQIHALRAALETAQARPVADEGTILQRVQDLLRENEERQTLRLNTSVASLDAQRRYDLARIGAGLSYLDGKTGQRMARTNELMGYVLQASEKK
jgi:hypothetical protein